MVLRTVHPDDDSEQSDKDKLDSDLDPIVYNHYVDSAELKSISVVVVRGERFDEVEATATKFTVKASYHVNDQAVQYRYDAVAQLGILPQTTPVGEETGPEDEPDLVGEIGASVVVTVDAEVLPDPEYLEEFGRNTAAFMAHPYLREALAATAQRLDFHGVILPIIKSIPFLDDGR